VYRLLADTTTKTEPDEAAATAAEPLVRYADEEKNAPPSEAPPYRLESDEAE